MRRIIYFPQSNAICFNVTRNFIVLCINFNIANMVRSQIDPEFNKNFELDRKKVLPKKLYGLFF